MEYFSNFSKVGQFLGSNKVEVLPWIQQSKMVIKNKWRHQENG